MANTLVDGGIIMSRVLVDKTILPRQILLYREFIRTVFLDTAAGQAAQEHGRRRDEIVKALQIFSRFLGIWFPLIRFEDDPHPRTADQN